MLVFFPFSRKVVVLQKMEEEAFGFEIQVRRTLQQAWSNLLCPCLLRNPNDPNMSIFILKIS